ncbi:hypothetical protein PL75_01180 [Neisseria arctica]|uniref:Uncharacterized protein n=1 Tax=Neisseria arctica TaxID=1470200 RepID=A0A0J0YU03_9NEIS|nr:ATP-binding protein [Neisseria arctica]KLT73594.1 hypothetical protein PL75_01180 [Neisseria arctica]UOO85714.1 ATP-binding protein [Neisseria arctica]
MENQKNTFEVNVSPEMQLYKVLQKLSYNMENAIAEFVDNSVQSYIDYIDQEVRPEKLEVQIEVDSEKKMLIIRDNAFGINRNNFQRAIRMGHKKDFSHQADSLSVYGIGLKSSAIWFSNTWKIETSALGYNEKLTASFDLNLLLHTGKDSIVVESMPEKIDSHYTSIVITNIERELEEEYFRDTVLPFLRETFFKFSFLKITIIFDQLVLQNDTDILSNPDPLIAPIFDKRGNCSGENITWKKLIELDYAGRKVKGFITIMNKGSYKQPGLRLLRNNRVVLGTLRDRNIPPELYQTSNKYAAQRIYGELHLDNFPVNFLKTGFDENLNGLYRLLHSELKGDGEKPDFINQAENFRARKPSKPKGGKSESSTDEDSNTPSSDIGSQPDPNTSSSGTGSQGSQPDKNISANDPIPEKIKFSEELYQSLSRLGNTKIQRFYKSLCRVCLKNDALLAYVCAWSFFESLKNCLNKDPGQEFTAFFNQKLDKLIQRKEEKKAYKQALSEIASKGNLCKHSAQYEVINAQQLAADFELLKDVLLDILKIHEKDEGVKN